MTDEQTQHTAEHAISLSFNDNSALPYLLGEHNDNIQYLEKTLSINIISRGNTLYLQGDGGNLYIARDILETLWQRAKDNHHINRNDIDTALRFLEEGKTMKDHENKEKSGEIRPYNEKSGIQTYKKNLILPRSPNQALYIDKIKQNDLVFGIGPAGTGKTYLAVAAAVSMYKAGDIERMVFCRPAVEAGEQLGFLPGDMMDKVDPYLRPIYDALHDMMPPDQVAKKIEQGDIEVAPLAFMRGRTLKNAFVILDEAQNTTSMQMKMFLTRMGEGTRMVITGDPSQVDLPHNTQSGLKEAMSILNRMDEIPFVHFEAKDVVRHKLVTKIIKAYDEHEFRSTRS